MCGKSKKFPRTTSLKEACFDLATHNAGSFTGRTKGGSIAAFELLDSSSQILSIFFNDPVNFFVTADTSYVPSIFLCSFLLKDGKCANAHLRAAGVKGGAEIMSTNLPHNLAQRATGSLPGRDCPRALDFT